MSHPEDATVDEELEAARRDLREGRTREALARLEGLRVRAPESARVAAGLAQAYLRSGRAEAALAVAREAALRAPQSPPALMALGQARKATHDLDGAREAFEQARALRDTPFVSVQLGRTLLALGRGEAALDLARGALRRHGEDAALRELEGDALKRLGRHAEAGVAFAAARDLAPDDPLAHKRLIESRLHDLAPPDALAELDALLAVPTYAGRSYLHELRGRRLQEAGRHEEARQAYAEAVRLEPGNAYLRKQLGFAASRAGDYAAAVQALRSAFLADPGDVYVRRTVLGALRKLERPTEALALIDEALAAHPGAGALHAERRRFLPAPEDAPPPPPKRPAPPRRARHDRERTLDLPLGPPAGPRPKTGHGR